ncbi:M28 family peptidase [Roseiconus nitratireducens]|uniref:M28 family peptidase n=1 Tax=Roseiconus nitratireducens TaxID=2605748 RepID=A0A5M6CYD7_9BACT|nr:M28 family peptidase [Roseiconus nitratireducens]KAA5540237.1 M28 family peptidase [Roseiconus nitratireducens]
MRYFLASLCLVATWSLSPPFGHALRAEEPPAEQSPSDTDDSAEKDSAEKEQELISNPRQITFEGLRAGEGYFNQDATQMVFQSERDPANPFYQIYLMDLQTGDIEKVSPGTGKTTCAWIHPSGDRILFSSTHHDPQSVQKQEELLQLRREGKQPRYAWDYDPEFEIYERTEDGAYHRLTDARGYDAEASYSPDGKQIVFASNRAAYSRDLSEKEAELLKTDKSYFIDLYIMDADGTNVRRLTDVRGYDGGPFFSPDGSRICWRRFSEDATTAEIYTMKTDGTDVRRLTDIHAMSWAPFFHPSGDYLIFTTNRHGFSNFELYCVRADGKGSPVRVTYTDGFDGLPVFLPGGDRLAWTSTRTPEKRSQIFLAEWDDAKIRELLQLNQEDDSDLQAARQAAEESAPEFIPADIARHVDFLTRPELEGRLTGTEGERRATAYVAAYLESLGFVPAGESDSFFQTFEFPAGSSLTDNNVLTVGDKRATLDVDWRPLAFSADGTTKPTEVVFAGYGMQVPGNDEVEEYDSYVHLNVADRWVLVFRDLPQDISPERRQQLARFSSPRRKATVARDLGAKGIIFVAGPTSKVRDELIRFDSNASSAGISIPAISVTNKLASELFSADAKLVEIQKELDDGSLAMGYVLEGKKVGTEVEIERKTGTGRNVIARLPAAESDTTEYPMVMVGAHIDHLGRGGGSNSLATGDEQDMIHQGADDNASGVAAMLEIAQYLANEKAAGRLDARRDFVVAAWSGEELGLFGSQAFIESFYQLYPEAPRAEVDEQAQRVARAHGMSPGAAPLSPAIAAYLNLDMVGRLRDKLVVQGVGSSPQFGSLVRRRNVPVGLPLTLDKTSTRLPTDASAFVARDVPILSGFTGAHEDYHTPRDTKEKLNYEGASDTAKLFALLARGLLTDAEPPVFELDEGEKKDQEVPRARLTAYLGTVPDYAAGDIKGLKLSGVAADGPAAKAGVRGGDVIVKLAGRDIEDIYDYTYAIEALKVGEPTDISVRRGEKTVELKITPSSRE